MSDAISNHGRLSQSSAAFRGALDRLDRQTAASSNPASTGSASQATETMSDPAVQVQLSNLARQVLTQSGFDSAKVDAIKEALQKGNYPLDPTRIAQSFVNLERRIPS